MPASETPGQGTGSGAKTGRSGPPLLCWYSAMKLIPTPKTRRKWLAITALCALSLMCFAQEPAHAVSKDTKTVLTAGAYGALGGTVLGLIAFPFSGKLRTIPIGTSIGLYLGAAVGFYHIWHRDDPGNPLGRGYSEMRIDQPEPPLFETQWAVLRF